MHESVQYPSGMKNKKSVQLYPLLNRYILSILLCVIVFLDGYNS